MVISTIIGALVSGLPYKFISKKDWIKTLIYGLAIGIIHYGVIFAIFYFAFTSDLMNSSYYIMIAINFAVMFIISYLLLKYVKYFSVSNEKERRKVALYQAIIFGIVIPVILLLIIGYILDVKIFSILAL